MKGEPQRRAEHIVEALVRGRWIAVGRVWGVLGEASAMYEYRTLARAFPNIRCVRRVVSIEVLARQSAKRGSDSNGSQEH